MAADITLNVTSVSQTASSMTVQLSAFDSTLPTPNASTKMARTFAMLEVG